MRSFIVVLMLALAGCNSNSSDDALNAQIAALDAKYAALQAQDNELKAELDNKFKQLQLIGRPIGTVAQTDSVRTFRMLGEPTLAPSAVTVTGQFGTCPNMGVQDGFNSSVGDALSANSKAFQTCTHYHVEYLTTDGSIKPAIRLFWDGPNCTGNLLEWEAGGAGFDKETLLEGVVFASPVDGTILMVSANQIPQPIMIQSVWVLSNPGCQSDIEIQKMYIVSANNTQISGVPNIAIGPYTTGSP